MIFVTVGTHTDQFTRLIKRIDEIAPYVKDKIIIQKGFTRYTPKNVEYFDFSPNLEDYFKKASLVIVQSATSLLEFVLTHKKPVITVPRQKKYGEHINDHQVEFAEYFAKKTGMLAVLNTNIFTADLLNNYNKVPKINRENLKALQKRFKYEFAKMEKQI